MHRETECPHLEPLRLANVLLLCFSSERQRPLRAIDSTINLTKLLARDQV
jgi:hypothetical protein